MERLQVLKATFIRNPIVATFRRTHYARNGPLVRCLRRFNVCYDSFDFILSVSSFRTASTLFLFKSYQYFFLNL